MTMPPEVIAEMRRLVVVERWRVETVARKFGCHHSVVRRALESAQKTERRPAPSQLDAFKPYVVERLTKYPELTASRLMLELRQKGYRGGVAQLRRFVSKVRVRPTRKAYLRVEFEPAEQGQVDWGSFGHLRVGHTKRAVSGFVMVLSWSRAIFVDFSFDQRLDTFMRLHRRALEYFGGVPKRVVYDNLKSVVLHHVGNTVQFNPNFLPFAGHYLFEPLAAPVRYPEFKGRVEHGVRYVRHSFFYGRSFASLGDLRRQARQWLDEVANVRVHKTTREKPIDRLAIEAPKLIPLQKRPFDTDTVELRVVRKEARIPFDANTYSVPPEYVGKSVHVRANDQHVRILCDGQEIAKHSRSWERAATVEDPKHTEKLIEQRKSAQPAKRRDRLAALAPECRQYLQEVARRRISLESEIRKLMALLKLYGDTELASGMAKALSERMFGARYVRFFIDQSRFARGLGEPPDPVVTGNRKADELVVEPHNLETYDALFEKQGPEVVKGRTDPSDGPERDAGDADAVHRSRRAGGSDSGSTA